MSWRRLRARAMVPSLPSLAPLPPRAKSSTSPSSLPASLRPPPEGAAAAEAFGPLPRLFLPLHDHGDPRGSPNERANEPERLLSEGRGPNCCCVGERAPLAAAAFGASFLPRCSPPSAAALALEGVRGSELHLSGAVHRDPRVGSEPRARRARVESARQRTVPSTRDGARAGRGGDAAARGLRERRRLALP